ERLVRGQEVDDARIGVEDIADEELDLLREVVDEVSGIIRKQVRIGLHLFEAVHVQPLEREVRYQRVRLRIGKHPANLRIEHIRLVQLLLHSELDQRVIRRATPQEERQP